MSTKRPTCGERVPGPESDEFNEVGGLACLRREGHMGDCISLLCDAEAADARERIYDEQMTLRERIEETAADFERKAKDLRAMVKEREGIPSEAHRLTDKAVTLEHEARGLRRVLAETETPLDRIREVTDRSISVSDLAPPCRCERTPGDDCIRCQVMVVVGCVVLGPKHHAEAWAAYHRAEAAIRAHGQWNVRQKFAHPQPDQHTPLAVAMLRFGEVLPARPKMLDTRTIGVSCVGTAHKTHVKRTGPTSAVVSFEAVPIDTAHRHTCHACGKPCSVHRGQGGSVATGVSDCCNAAASIPVCGARKSSDDQPALRCHLSLGHTGMHHDISRVLTWGEPETNPEPSAAHVPDQPPPAQEHADVPAVWDLVRADVRRYGHDPAKAEGDTFTAYGMVLDTLTLLAKLAGHKDLDALMAERDQIGRERYGTPLQPHNGRKALIDALQEASDLAVYLRQHLYEQDHPVEEPSR